MFHVELRQRPHVARAFNLTEAELIARFLGPQLAGRTLQYADREWEPRRTRLTVLEGPEVPLQQMGMGRGWAGAARDGSDVTVRLLARARELANRPAGLDRLKECLLGRLEAGPLALTDAVELAGELLPGRRASQRLGLAELAVWELLHERRAELLSGPAGLTVGEDEWRPRLLAWSAWAQATTSSIMLARSASDANR